MQRLKLLAVACLAVFALTAVASASASAEACKKQAGSKKWVLCVEGQRIGSPTEDVTVPLTFHVKVGTSATFEVFQENEMKCSKVAPGVTAHWDSKLATLQSLVLEVSQCSAFTLINCKLHQPFVLGNGGGTSEMIGRLGPGVENIALTKANGVFVEYFRLEGNNCGQFGSWRVTGQGPECTIAEVQVEKAEQQMKCDKSKTRLSIGNPGQYPFRMGLEESVELAEAKKGQKFSIIESA